MAEAARQDAKDDLIQPARTSGGSIARTVGRLYASSGTSGGSGACTATVIGIRTMITAAHCVRRQDLFQEGASCRTSISRSVPLHDDAQKEDAVPCTAAEEGSAPMMPISS
jgi:hypothetical protein